MLISRLNIWIGLIAITAIVAFAAAVWLVRVEVRMRTQTYRARAVFTNVGGLIEHSPVQFAGVVIGDVRRLRVLPDGKIAVMVEMRLKRPIPVDSVLCVSSTMITGDTFINVFRGKSQELLKPYEPHNLTEAREMPPTLKAINFMTIADAAGNYENLGKLISAVLTNCAAIIGSGEKSLPAQISAIAQSSEKISDSADRAKAGFSVTLQRIHKMSDEIQAAIAGGKQIQQQISAAFPENSGAEIFINMQTISADLTAVKAVIAAQSSEREKLVDAYREFTAWRAQVAYSPRSVIGVLLTDPQYSAAATIREFSSAYHSITGKPPLAKASYFIGGVIRGRGVAKKFMRQHSRDLRSDTEHLTDFYRDWQTFAYQQKMRNNYIAP